jgi:hypothetical protein
MKNYNILKKINMNIVLLIIAILLLSYICYKKYTIERFIDDTNTHTVDINNATTEVVDGVGENTTTENTTTIGNNLGAAGENTTTIGTIVGASDENINTIGNTVEGAGKNKDLNVPSGTIGGAAGENTTTIGNNLGASDENINTIGNTVEGAWGVGGVLGTTADADGHHPGYFPGALWETEFETMDPYTVEWRGVYGGRDTERHRETQ